MALGEKLQIMEAIWDDLRDRFESSEVSPQIKALLDERRARVQRRETCLQDWDAIKGSIGRL